MPVNIPSSITFLKLPSGWEQPVRINTFSAAAKRFITISGTVKQGSKEPQCEFICDSGAEVSILPISFAVQEGLKIEKALKRLEMADGTRVNCKGVVQVEIKVRNKMCKIDCYVVDAVQTAIMGLDVLGVLGIALDPKSKSANLVGAELYQSEVPSNQSPTQKCYHIVAAQTCLIEPAKETFIWGKLEQESKKFDSTVCVEGTERFKERTGLMTAPVCIAPEEIEDGRIPICVWNISAKPIRVYREQSAATVEELPAKVIPQTATTREYDPVPEVQIGKQLSDSEVTRVKNLLRENADVFDYPGNEGYTTTETYTIPTGDAEPITCPPRRHNFSLTEKINDAVEMHLKAGHIKPSRSPWAFPVVPVMKPDKTVRLCVDYKPLNNVTQSDAFPTGNINEVLDNIVGAQYFSVIDLAQGYLQVPLAEKDQAKIAFRSPTGFWEWTRMCYGLKGSPATFARLMRNVVNQNPPERLALYMDDLCVVSKTFDDHVRNLQQVFDAL